MPAKVLLLSVIMMLASVDRVSAYANEEESIRDTYVRKIMVCVSRADAFYVYGAAATLDGLSAQGVGHLLGCRMAVVAIDGPSVRRCEAGRWSRCGQFPVALEGKVYFGIILPHAVDAAAR